jgi:hypothetical protein
MSTKDTRDLREFAALAAKLAKHEARERVTYSSLMTATRIMERMAAIRDGASPKVRDEFAKKYGWKTKAPRDGEPHGALCCYDHAHQQRRASR